MFKKHFKSFFYFVLKVNDYKLRVSYEITPLEHIHWSQREIFAGGREKEKEKHTLGKEGERKEPLLESKIKRKPKQQSPNLQKVKKHKLDQGVPVVR